MPQLSEKAMMCFEESAVQRLFPGSWWLRAGCELGEDEYLAAPCSWFVKLLGHAISPRRLAWNLGGQWYATNESDAERIEALVGRTVYVEP